MPSSDQIEPTRLETLLGGASPETEREALVQGLVRELRAGMPQASPALRERVQALDTPSSKTRSRVGRRAVLALALVTFLACSAVLAGLITRSSGEEPGREAAPTTPTATSTTPASTTPAVAEEASGSSRAGGSDTTLFPSGQTLVEGTRADAGSAKAALPVPGARAQDIDMSIELRVADANELSDATNDAMQATRSLGGVVRSSTVDTRGGEGTARLQLQIPVGRLEDAVLRFSALGTITAQDVATRDLQGGIDRRARQLQTLRRAIERDELILASGTLSPDEKLEVELRLAGERARLSDLRRERQSLLREAALAELALTLHTRAAPKGDEDKGGVAGAAADALDFLGGAGAVAVFALVVLSPLLALAALLWAVLRARRRRLDDRLLEQPRPHAPPS